MRSNKKPTEELFINAIKSKCDSDYGHAAMLLKIIEEMEVHKTELFAILLNSYDKETLSGESMQSKITIHKRVAIDLSRKYNGKLSEIFKKSYKEFWSVKTLAEELKNFVFCTSDLEAKRFRLSMILSSDRLPYVELHDMIRHILENNNQEQKEIRKNPLIEKTVKRILTQPDTCLHIKLFAISQLIKIELFDIYQNPAIISSTCKQISILGLGQLGINFKKSRGRM